ncbi:MAG: hypothetical protein LBH70_05610 [Spirochaetaceae bacterium]|jgi:hypothetical protein|nr:hypothetical protein [Spirochaetaceae bacterium]
MKKIIIALFILILGGTVFFFGWVQIRVPPGSYGVMRSKTHGIDPAVIKEGEFRWVWYALIPANVELNVFTQKPVEQPIRITGSLPSGNAYAVFAGLDADFSYEYTGSLLFMVRPDQFPVLMEESGVVTQEDLDAFQRRIAGEIVSYAERRLREYAKDGVEIEDSHIDMLKEDILREYPYIENLYCSINTVQYPDLALYHSLQKIYEVYSTGQQQPPDSDVPLPANRQLNARIRLEELAKYGELLTKYPILLQYLALENKNGELPELSGD